MQRKVKQYSTLMHGPAFFAREEKKRGIELYACFTNIEKCATLEIHLYPVSLTDKLDTMIITFISFICNNKTESVVSNC